MRLEFVPESQGWIIIVDGEPVQLGSRVVFRFRSDAISAAIDHDLAYAGPTPVEWDARRTA